MISGGVRASCACKRLALAAALQSDTAVTAAGMDSMAAVKLVVSRTKARPSKRHRAAEMIGDGG